MYSRRHLLLYYYKYKDSPYFSLSLFLILVLIVFLLMMKVVLPQMYNWFSINNEVNATRQRISAIEANIQYVNSLNEQDLAEKRSVLVRALPFEKDIQAILATISSSAIASGVGLDDFSISIGELSPKNPQATLGSINFSLSIKGTPEMLRDFISNLQTRVPLVQVSNVQLASDTSQIALGIAFKPLPLFKVNDTTPIKKISTNFEDLFLKLNTWSQNTDSVVNTSLTPLPSQ